MWTSHKPFSFTIFFSSFTIFFLIKKTRTRIVQKSESMPTRQLILLVGLPFSGKSSMHRIVFGKKTPGETTGLKPTTFIQKIRLFIIKKSQINQNRNWGTEFSVRGMGHSRLHSSRYGRRQHEEDIAGDCCCCLCVQLTDAKFFWADQKYGQICINGSVSEWEDAVSIPSS